MYEAQKEANVAWLFQTEAFKVSPEDKPFSFTSGLLGPYFIATHYLCGGIEVAESILDAITEEAEDRAAFPQRICEVLHEAYARHDIFKSVVDSMAALAAEAFPLSEITHISGGQRRDWFFSPLLAEKLDKPCLYLYNDLAIIDEVGDAVEDLQGAQVLHVADLLTVGSSYVKKWCPAIAALGGRLLWSLNGVDRNQGGQEELRSAGVIGCESLFVVSDELFRAANQLGLISEAQREQLSQYLADPYETMRNFLRAHPKFISEALASPDEKVRTRTRLLVDENLYNLDSPFA